MKILIDYINKTYINLPPLREVQSAECRVQSNTAQPNSALCTLHSALILILLLLPLLACAQSIQVQGPNSVITGENFRMEYVVNTDDVSDVRLNGSAPSGLEEVAGPYVSTQTNYQIINGHSSSSSSARITFIFYAEKPGTYNLPSVTLTAAGKRLTSRTHQVRVTGSAAQGGSSQSAPRMHQQNDRQDEAQSSAPAGKGDVFIKVTADKTSVVEQEPVRITYKLYTASQITVPSDLKMPNVQDFTIHEIQQPTHAEWHTETVGGKTFRSAVWKQYVVYPQQAGKLTVPGSSVQINRVVRGRNIDPIEEMFNPGGSYHEEAMDIAVPALTISVKELPDRPENFSGGVGKFSMTATLSAKQVKAGEPVTVSVRVSGQGNLKLLKQPIVNFPKDFEVYDAKVTDKTHNTGSGIEGSMTYEFIAVPQNKGSYTIPPAEFTYYDPQLSAYKTIKGSQMKLTVLEGAPNSGEQGGSQQQNVSDIYSIKSIDDIAYRNTDRFFLSAVYIVILALLIVSFALLLYIFRKRAIERADIMKVKANNANKVARKRLATAADYMERRRKEEFYDEVLRALWGYAADKISIPVEALSKDNICEKLLDRGCNSFSIDKFTKAIEECEFARYAPSKDPQTGMSSTYDMAITAITEIEEALKTAKSKFSSKKQAVLIFALIQLSTFNFQLSASAATTLETANEAYLTGNYQQAITLYEQALKAGHSPQIYYNLGNAYYRTGQLTQAIVNYERAHLFAPADEQTSHNLQYVAGKTKDKMPQQENPVYRLYLNIVFACSIYGWALLSIIAIFLSMIALLGYLFTPHLSLRKGYFWTVIVTFIVFILSIVFALCQRSHIEGCAAAVITAEEVTLKASPEASAKDVITLHEGTHIDITDDNLNDWKQVELPDGKTGWLKPNAFERVLKAE